MANTAGAPAASSSSPTRPRTRRPWLYAALALVAAVPLLVLVAMLAVSLTDWNRARPWVNERVSAATGRHFAITGDLEAHWVWPQPLDTGWRHWVPGLRVEASGLELANRDGFGRFGALDAPDARAKPPALSAPEPQEAPAETAPPLMARVAQASAHLRLLPLLGRVLLIDTLVLTGPDVALAR